MLRNIRTAFLDLAAAEPAIRPMVLALTRLAEKWEKMPEGWNASSRKKFWDTLTGDNKHKVTKCIKEMSKGDKSIDDPGAFCAALADRVLGKEWRSKKAGQEQLPNAVDGAAARFRDHLDLKVNEHYRTAFPAMVPPTLSLIHGNDFIRVVKADGGLTRVAVAFVARSTGNIYQAASWERPLPGVVANVLDSQTWRSMQLGPDMENPMATRPGRLAELRLLRNGPDPRQARLAELRSQHQAAWDNPVDAFINPKTMAFAKSIMGYLKKIKPSFDPKPDVPSNVGGFISFLFYALGDMAGSSKLHSFFGNMSDVGSGFRSDNDLSAVARMYAGKVNKAEAVAIGVLLLRGARRPNAAQKFTMWAVKNLDLSKFTPDTNAEAPSKAADEFERQVKAMTAFAGRAIHELGKENALYFAYSVVEDINWHSLNRTGVLGDGHPVTPIDDGVDHRLLALVQQRIDYGVEDAAVYIVALLRLAGERGAALAVKRNTLKNFPDYFEG